MNPITTRLLSLVTLIAAGLTQFACSTTLLSWEEERALGAEAAPQFTAEFGGPVPDQALQRYVDEVGQRLVAQIEEGVPPLDWEFTLLDSSVINAFALPGGKVFLTRGLAQEFTTESQLAGVLGHEIGHVTARHGNQRISKQLGMNLLLGAAAVGVGIADSDSDVRRYGQYAVPALALGGNVVMLKYGRDEESQADELGVRYMARAGYNPTGQLEVMRILQAAGGSSGGRPPEWLSTHPFPETRIKRLEELLAEQYANILNNPGLTDNAEVYQRRMLSRLRSLPAPTHTALGPASAPGQHAIAANVLGGCDSLGCWNH
jgi:predicted Zn-dependent protease